MANMGEFFSVSKKLAILNQAETSGNITATASDIVQSNQICYWWNVIEKLIQEKTENCKAYDVHSVSSAHFTELVNQAFESFWILFRKSLQLNSN